MYANHFLEEALLFTLSTEHRFQVTRVALSTLQLRSPGGPFLPLPRLASRLLVFSSLFVHSVSRLLSSSLPYSSALSRVLLPCLLNFLLSRLSDPLYSILCTCSCIPVARLSRVPKQAADMNDHLIRF